MKNLTDKVCVIADASEKIGSYVSLFLAKQSAKIVLCFDDENKIDKSLISQLDALNAKYKIIINDFSNFETVQKLVDEIKEDKSFGLINAMFYNICPPVVRQSIADMPRSVLSDFINNYVIKAYSATKVVSDAMGNKDGGVIIYRGSVNDDKPTGVAAFNSMYYAMIKNLNREAAIYYGYYNVRFINLEFGAVDKEDEEYHNDISTFYDGYQYKIPSGYTGNGNDYGSLISYLFSDECKMINGADIRIDNGLLFQYIEAVMTIATHERLKREGKE